MPRGRPLGPGHPGWRPFQPGESGRERARAKQAQAVEILTESWRVLAQDATIAAVIERVDQTTSDPVERARRTLQELAPHCVRIVLAIAHCDAHKMLAYVGPLRVRLDAALQALNRAGLKDTVAVEHGFSERFEDVMRAWFPPGNGNAALEAGPAALPPDPGEPARRRRPPAAPDRNQP